MYRLELLALMKVLGVDSKYRMAQIIGMPNIAHFYRYFRIEDGYTPASKYLLRMLHLTRKVLQGTLDIATFDPDTYWPDIEEELIEREKNAQPFSD